jgi:DNA repair protein SbcC/Rad50
MRPIVMDMNGFASFREPTRVDFTDADFFALVGPTGAGKSTVIDAMTFALYGSVPRWGRKGQVSLALAPAVARATVKLVFEVDRQRYVIARELRRMGTQVSQRSVSLEQVLDPGGLAEKGDKTAPVAKDIDGVAAAVERLLGLSYEDFTQCVVLPQGKFADFLHAQPAIRQKILLRLLGAEHYEQMMMKANQRASVAAQRAETIGESLLNYADATEDSEERSRAAQVTLTALADQVTQTLPRIWERQAELSAAEERLRRLRADHAALSVLRVPDDVAALDSDLTASQAEVARLKKAEQEAEDVDTAARGFLAAGPQRSPLELARDRRGERRRLRARVPTLEAEALQLAARVEAASAAVKTGSAVLEDLRSRRDEAARDATVAGELVTRLEREHALLGAVSVPEAVTALDERRQAAVSAEAEAARALAEVEEADTAARAACDAAVPETPLAQVARDLNDLRDLLAGLENARRAAGQARAAWTSAEDELPNATEALRKRREVLEEVQRAYVVAGLRPHLVAGEACPVCEQTVTTLPAVMTAPEVDDARSRLGEAERAEQDARSAAKKADLSVVKAEGELRSKVARQTSLVGSLANVLAGPLASAPLPATRAIEAAGTSGADGMVIDAGLVDGALAEIGALAGERAELDRAAKSAAKDMEAGRARHRAAQLAAARADHDVSAARDALRVARDPLVQFGAPQVDAADLAVAWAALDTWAAEQKQARATDLREAREAAKTAVDGHQETAAGFSEAERALARLRVEENSAVKGDQQAMTQLSEVTERVAELDTLLQNAPDEEQLTEQLALIELLEDAAARAGKSLQAARAVRAKGETALAVLARAEGTARARLSNARDSVVALGAPALDGWGLLDAWTELAAWAASQAASREQQVATASAEVSTAEVIVGQLTCELSAALAEAAIELAPDAVVTGAAPAVAAALERVRAAAKRIVERRAEAADLRDRQQVAQEEHQVARLLGDLLRANNFQRWLVNATVDDLVEEASATLSALSSGQFDLAYDDGDFYVIDHTDADARRSVRTLSGGETFQASLALALALSSQISALSAAGAARLDSIFLDEGFGTLDPETLEVVATTLETLAQGERMVGVVTHVPALAERVPVRFRVTRSARTSTITREGFATVADEEAMA